MAQVRVRRETQSSTVKALISSTKERGIVTLSNATLRAARGTTPSRSGLLRSMNRIEPVRELTPDRSVGGVRNDTRYAAAVHDGSGLYAGGDYIRGNPGMRWVNAGGEYSGAWMAHAVRGQPGTFFLLRAYNIARHSVGFFQPIRGFVIPTQSAPAYNDAVQKVRKLHLASRR